MQLRSDPPAADEDLELGFAEVAVERLEVAFSVDEVAREVLDADGREGVEAVVLDVRRAREADVEVLEQQEAGELVVCLDGEFARRGVDVDACSAEATEVVACVALAEADLDGAVEEEHVDDASGRVRELLRVADAFARYREPARAPAAEDVAETGHAGVGRVLAAYFFLELHLVEEEVGHAEVEARDLQEGVQHVELAEERGHLDEALEVAFEEQAVVLQVARRPGLRAGELDPAQWSAAGLLRDAVEVVVERDEVFYCFPEPGAGESTSTFCSASRLRTRTRCLRMGFWGVLSSRR